MYITVRNIFPFSIKQPTLSKRVLLIFFSNENTRNIENCDRISFLIFEEIVLLWGDSNLVVINIYIYIKFTRAYVIGNYHRLEKFISRSKMCTQYLEAVFCHVING